MATSGIAATLLPNGRTIHSKLKVPLKLHDKSELPYDQYGKGFTQLINETELMIVDEVMNFKSTHIIALNQIFILGDNGIKIDIRNNR